MYCWTLTPLPVCRLIPSAGLDVHTCRARDCPANPLLVYLSDAASTAQDDRVYAEDPVTGVRRNLTLEESHAFWAWATVEMLRHTGGGLTDMLPGVPLPVWIAEQQVPA